MAALEQYLPPEIDPHNYVILDHYTHSAVSRIGPGCYRTRPTADSDCVKLRNWDIKGVQDRR